MPPSFAALDSSFIELFHSFQTSTNRLHYMCLYRLAQGWIEIAGRGQLLGRDMWARSLALEEKQTRPKN